MKEEKAPQSKDEPGASVADEEPKRMFRPILRTIAASRYIFVLAVVTTFVAAVALLLAGSWVGIEMVLHALGLGRSNIPLRAMALETVDYFLVALVLYLLSLGFYQLLLDGDLDLPDWLRVTTPDRMERHLLGVIVTVMSVDALIEVANRNASSNLLGYGVAVAAIITAITFYIWVNSRHDD